MDKRGLALRTYFILGFIGIIMSGSLFTVFSYSNYKSELATIPTQTENQLEETPIGQQITHIVCENFLCVARAGVGTNDPGCDFIGDSCAVTSGGGGGGSSGRGSGSGGGSSPSSAVCGNNVVETGEVCDPPGATRSCSLLGSVGSGSAAQTCNSQCSGYSTCSSIFCGNGVLEPGEECDDLGQQSEPSCTASCTINTRTPPIVAGFYEIDSVGELNYVRTKLDGNYKLVADLNLNNYRFEPIGGDNSPFTGTFNGLGHSISHFKFNNVDYADAGLFSSTGTGAQISNLNLSMVNVEGKSGGALVGANLGNINNVFVQGDVFMHGISNEDSTGLIVGESNGNIIAAHGRGNVKGGAIVGGLAGSYFLNSLEQSSFIGSVNSIASNGLVGGLIGLASSASRIEQSYSKSSISGGSLNGGLAGGTFGATIVDSYASTTFSGSAIREGLIGSSQGSTSVIRSYWDQDSSGVSSSISGGTPLRYWQMINGASYFWDFNSIWNIEHGCSTPWLRNEGRTPGPCDGLLMQINYPLNELANGNTPDISVHMRDGEVLGGASLIPSSFGNVMVFDGVNDLVNSNADVDLTGAFTLSAWIKLSDIPSSGTYRIIDKSADGFPTAYSLLIDSNGRLVGRLRASSQGAEINLISQQALSTSTWYMVTFVRENSGISRLYIDAQETSSAITSPVPYNINGPVTVGAQTSASFSNYFRGNIRDVRIYSKALNASEIANIRSLSCGNCDFLDTFERDVGLSPGERPTFWSSHLAFILWMHLLLLIMLILVLAILSIVKHRRLQDDEFYNPSAVSPDTATQKQQSSPVIYPNNQQTTNFTG